MKHNDWIISMEIFVNNVKEFKGHNVTFCEIKMLIGVRYVMFQQISSFSVSSTAIDGYSTSV